MRRALMALAAMAAVLSLTGCGSDEEAVSPYDKAPVPAVPDRTQALPAADAPLPAGQYWATATGVDGPAVKFTLAQAFFGPTCVVALGQDACDGDVGVQDTPSRDILVAPTGVSPLSVVSEDRENFAVPADEFVRLVAGDAPSSDAPDGFAFQPYPFLVTVAAGNVTGIQQIWMP